MGGSGNSQEIQDGKSKMAVVLNMTCAYVMRPHQRELQTYKDAVLKYYCFQSLIVTALKRGWKPPPPPPALPKPGLKRVKSFRRFPWAY